MPTLSELRKERRKKAKALRVRGINPYPAFSHRTDFASDVITQFDILLEKKRAITIAGRITSIRIHGKASFIDIEDATAKIQLFVSAEGTQEYQFFLDVLDEGDIIEASGIAYLSSRQEKSIAVETLRVLTKSFNPLPKEWFGIKDVEERFRKRYLDLLFNEKVRERFIKTDKILTAIRSYLHDNGFIEVKTPILQPLAGGALAKPFKTHLNALDVDLYLRIAPELYLKRLLVGGFEKIYEMGESFRNEGVDREHNPEFTMLELYWAYQDWQGLMEFTAMWLSSVASSVGITLPSGPWPEKEFETLLKDYTGIEYKTASAGDLLAFAKKEHIVAKRALSKGKIADEIYKKLIRPHLENPTFVTKLPLDISPFAKRLDDDPTRTARFILCIKGIELVNGFSELNDPVDQEERFAMQQEMKVKGDEEVTEYDKDFIEALEYGMPPAAGLGLGVTRFIMLLTGASTLRETMLFPLMRPKERV